MPFRVVVCPDFASHGIRRGHCYEGRSHDLHGRQDQAAVFSIGADLQLGAIYYLVPAPFELRSTPTSYAWEWMGGGGWSYLGELPAFRARPPRWR